MREFIKGVDISSLPSYVDAKEVFRDESGNVMEAFDLLEKYGVNSVRLRIWNQPELYPESGGYCDYAHTLAMAKKIKAHHMHFMLDFHYSDFWADPERQRKPIAWKNLSFEELQQAVYDYTTEVLTALQKEDCLPDMVQVGNEIRSGLLFPDGAVPNYGSIALLLNAGIRAVRDISDDIRIMLHLDQGGRFYHLKYWFDSVFGAGLLPIDAIGLSFYSFWHGTFMDLKNSMRQLIETYGLPVYVVETAHPWRICPGGQVAAGIMKTAGLPAGIDEQRRVVELILQIVASMPDEMGMGVYYWEPLCIPNHGHGTWDENMGMLDEEGRPFPSLAAYRDFTRDSHPIEDLDAYMESLYIIDPSEIPPAGTNLIPNGDFSDGDRDWWVYKVPTEVEAKIEGGELYVSSLTNFTFYLHRNIHIQKTGRYVLSVDYRGSNTTGALVELYLKEISCNGETCFTKEIFPSDVDFVTHMMEPLELSPGELQIGIHIEAPPIYGRIKNLRLVEVE